MKTPTHADLAEATPLICSFCGKSQHEVRKIINGLKGCICDECVEVCEDIIIEEWRARLADMSASLDAIQNHPVRRWREVVWPLSPSDPTPDAQVAA